MLIDLPSQRLRQFGSTLVALLVVAVLEARHEPARATA
jgi:hypothetical protein